MKEYDICFVSSTIPPDFAGAGNRALNQAKFIANNGYNVLFLTNTKTNSDINSLDIKTIVMPEWYYNKSFVYKLLRKLYLPLYFKKILSVLKNSKIKIIHCIPGSHWISLLTTFIGNKILDVKTIVETTLDGSDDPVSIKKSRLGWLKFYLFNKADAIVNISPLLYEKCQKAGIKENKLYKIPNSVDINTFAPPTKKEKNELKEKLNLNSEVIFLYVGVIRERKGVGELVDIYRELNKEYNNSCLVLAGPQKKDKENRKYTKMIKNKIKKYGIESNVIMPGEIQNVEEWMKAANFFLFASKREGFGTVLIEAMSCGLPVLSKKIEGITSYIIEDNEDGYIIENEKDFINTINDLLNNEFNRINISNKARKKALKKFSLEVVMNNYFTLYNELLEENYYRL